MWQHKYIHWIGATVAFALPAAIGYAWGGWTAPLGAFLIAGVARVVVMQHCTFCINSLCHYIGRQTYSSRCSARDSWLMAVVTFGEGYQLLPRVSLRLPEWREAVAVRSHEMDHLDALKSRLGKEVAACPCRRNSRR